MFYATTKSRALRFGDVLRGFLSTTPVIKEPALTSSFKKYLIDVNLPEFSVVIDPCSQIGKQAISLTPLSRITSTFFDNPYLAEDLTRLNRIMLPEKSMPPHEWTKLSPEEKLERKTVGDTYAFVSRFIYDKHDSLPQYSLKKGTSEIETGYYMIDFRNIHRLNCDAIISAEKAPLESKVLELSIETRRELRDKITSYYAYVPKEDQIED
jgi:hypothetical protein